MCVCAYTVNLLHKHLKLVRNYWMHLKWVTFTIFSSFTVNLDMVLYLPLVCCLKVHSIFTPVLELFLHYVCLSDGDNLTVPVLDGPPQASSSHYQASSKTWVDQDFQSATLPDYGGGSSVANYTSSSESGLARGGRVCLRMGLVVPVVVVNLSAVHDGQVRDITSLTDWVSTKVV